MRRRGGGRSGGGGRRGWSGGGLTKNLKHHGAAGRTFAFDGFAAIFHGFFHTIGNRLLGLALNAISFGHIKIYRQRFMRQTVDRGYPVRGTASIPKETRIK